MFTDETITSQLPGVGAESPCGFVAGDANVRRYVGNDPTNSTDPSGLAPPGRRGVSPDAKFQDWLSSAGLLKLDDPRKPGISAEEKIRRASLLIEAIARLRGGKSSSYIGGLLPQKTPSGQLQIYFPPLKDPAEPGISSEDRATRITLIHEALAGLTPEEREEVRQQLLDVLPPARKIQQETLKPPPVDEAKIPEFLQDMKDSLPGSDMHWRKTVLDTIDLLFGPVPSKRPTIEQEIVKPRPPQRKGIPQEIENPPPPGNEGLNKNPLNQ